MKGDGGGDGVVCLGSIGEDSGASMSISNRVSLAVGSDREGGEEIRRLILLLLLVPGHGPGKAWSVGIVFRRGLYVDGGGIRCVGELLGEFDS